MNLFWISTNFDFIHDIYRQKNYERSIILYDILQDSVQLNYFVWPCNHYAYIT